MKKLLIMLSLLLFCCHAAFADDIQPEQAIKNNQAYFTANLQKQPQEGKQKQGIIYH